MASGWNLWVWLVSVVRRYIIDILIIIITFPYSTCISSFFGSIIPISLFIFKCFFVLYTVCVCAVACSQSDFCGKVKAKLVCLTRASLNGQFSSDHGKQSMLERFPTR